MSTADPAYDISFPLPMIRLHPSTRWAPCLFFCGNYLWTARKLPKGLSTIVRLKSTEVQR